MKYFAIGVIVFSATFLIVLLYWALNLRQYLPGLLRGCRNALAWIPRLFARRASKARTALIDSWTQPADPVAQMATAAGPASTRHSTTSRTVTGAPMFELRGRVAQLQLQGKTIARRNRFLLVALLLGCGLLILVLAGVYQVEVRAYAVLEDIKIEQDPTDDGVLKISFRVVSPGRVDYQRISGSNQTEKVDHFSSPLDLSEGKWTWPYEHGEDILIRLRYRKGLWRTEETATFPTTKHADIVIIMDTTESMGYAIHTLQEKCIAFSSRLEKQQFEHRFALIGFGDILENEKKWLTVKPFTPDVAQFQRQVKQIERFEGGDLPESALDALEEALKLPLQKGSLRRFYLVTDATYHNPARSGVTPAKLAQRFKEEHIVLQVFSRPEFKADYEKLTGETGKFLELGSFGEALTQGRIIED